MPRQLSSSTSHSKAGSSTKQLTKSKKSKSLNKRSKQIFLPNYFEQFRGALSNRWKVLEEIKNKSPTLPKLPKYISHCTYRVNTGRIIEDKQFGGREILSGSVWLTPEITHFSVTPFLTGNYGECLIFDTERLKERNVKRSIFPTIYELESEGKKYYAYFDDRGWQRFPEEDLEKEEIPSKKKFRLLTHSIDEREWNMENPIKFKWDDISGYLLQESSSFGYFGKDGYFNDLFLDPKNPIDLINYNRIRKNSYFFRKTFKAKDFQFEMKPIFPEEEIVVAFSGKGENFSSNYVLTKQEYEKGKEEGNLPFHMKDPDEYFDEYILVTKDGTFLKG